MWSCVQCSTFPEGSLDTSFCWRLEGDTMGAQGNSTSNSKSAHSHSPKILDGSKKNTTLQTEFTKRSVLTLRDIFIHGEGIVLARPEVIAFQLSHFTHWSRHCGQPSVYLQSAIQLLLLKDWMWSVFQHFICKQYFGAQINLTQSLQVHLPQLCETPGYKELQDKDVPKYCWYTLWKHGPKVSYKYEYQLRRPAKLLIKLT